MCIYCAEGPTWSSSTITCSFANSGGPFTAPINVVYQTVIQAAIVRWEQVANITFQIVPDSANSNIRIASGGFTGSQVGETRYSYNQSNSFVSGTTVAFEDPSLKYVDASINATYAATSTTLYQVALHEIGHVLGLAHDSDPNSIMYATLGSANRDLDSTDIDGIRALYGSSMHVSASMASNASTSPAIDLEGATPTSGNNIDVYRFFDNSTGTQFLTGSLTERNSLIATRSDLHYEGLGMRGIANGTADPNATPVYRFFDTNNGTHFFTASSTEANMISATRSDMIAEDANFMEHITPQAGDSAAYRFFDTHNGTHFFTVSATEQANIISTRPDMTYEGIAFYTPQP